MRVIGECYDQLGMVDDAIIYLAASIGLIPNPKAYYLLAQALVKAGSLMSAEKAVRAAVAQLPHFNQAVILLDEIQLLRKNGKSDTS